MKLALTLLMVLLLTLHVAAQSPPQRFSYQAVVRNSSGILVSNQTVGIRVSILAGSTTGNPILVETHRPTTNTNGLITLEVGGGTISLGALSIVLWQIGPYYIKTEIDPTGGTNYTIAGTSQLLSVPYALYALSAGSAGHYIGELFGGGIIFSVWRDHLGVEHGLIASLDDLGNRQWASTNITATVATSHENGAANTADLVVRAGSNSAAVLCDSYTTGLFSDWYLPATWELNQLYNQAVAINAVLNNDNNSSTNGLGQDSYWSSTIKLEISNPTSPIEDAWLKRFRHVQDYHPLGADDNSEQTNVHGVRAIRRF